MVADVHLRGDAARRVRVALLEEPAVELAAGDDPVRVAQFLAQIDRGAVQVGAGVEPDGERHRPLHQAMKQVRAGAGVIAPVREDVIVLVGMLRRPGPGLGEDVDTLGERSRPESRRGQAHGGRVAHERRDLPQRPRSRVRQTLQEAEVMHPVPRQDVLAEDVEAVAPQARIEGRDREHVDRHAGLEQRPHVTLEKGGDPRRVRAGEHREPQRRGRAHHER